MNSSLFIASGWVAGKANICLCVLTLGTQGQCGIESVGVWVVEHPKCVVDCLGSHLILWGLSTHALLAVGCCGTANPGKTIVVCGWRKTCRKLKTINAFGSA